jgi:death-on-curing protein
LFEKAAALIESIARNHALVDGNKRLAWVATRLFLALNGEDVRAPSPEAGDEFVRAVAQGQPSLAEIAATLASWRTAAPT